MKLSRFKNWGWIAALALLVGLFYGLGQSQVSAFAPDTIYLPAVARNDMVGNMISGQVLDLNNQPVSGVAITTNSGLSAMTNETGQYILDGLDDQVYTVIPHKAGASFYPPAASVVVPPDVVHVNFTTSAAAACDEEIVNGGFETGAGWELPITEYPADYSTAQVHGGARAMRTGITQPAHNQYSYSSARQQVTIPSSVSDVVLGFWVYPRSEEALAAPLPERPLAGASFGATALDGDIQYVLVLDQYNNIVETLVWMRSDSRIWTYYQFDLSDYIGQTIKLHFGAYNDGLSGITSMFLDDVSLQFCPGSGATPTPTATALPGACNNQLENESFEYDGDWDIPVTEYSAGYSTDQHQSGVRSMRTGITNPSHNRYSYSDFRQAVYVPAATSTRLGFWLYSQSGEAASKPVPAMPTTQSFGEAVLAGDVQYVLILDHNQYWIDTLVWQRSDNRTWTYFEFDLRRYAGRTIYIQFGTYNDGWGGVSAMFVDMARLEACNTTPIPSATVPSPTITLTPTNTPTPTHTPTPTPTAPPTHTPTPTPTSTNTPTPTITNTPTVTHTPGPCQEEIINGGFENSDGWEILNTVYKAAYSTVEVHSGARSMRAGIVNPADNIYSYSDFRQTVTFDVGPDATLGFWLYPLSTEAESLPLPPIPEGPVFGESPLAYDAQYLLVVFPNGDFEVLLWQRSNSRIWTYHEIDLSDYAGQTIHIQFGVYNDGYGGITAMYVDDVSLEICP
jgi:hypothetical protein